MRNKATICRIDCIGCGYCSGTWNTSYCDFWFTFGSCGVFFITHTWLKWCNNNLSLGTILFEDFLFLCWCKSTCTGIDRISGCLLNHIIAFFKVFNLILGWDLDHCMSWRFDNWFSFMWNKASICRINRVGGSYCSGTWCTSFCDFYFTFGSCGIFLITNTWLKWGNNNCGFSAI